MIKSFKIFEENSYLNFKKLPRKKGAKTDVFDVIKGKVIIGQVKWSSRMRGYSFLPTTDSDAQVKAFVKDLMKKRRAEKVNESNNISSKLDYIRDLSLEVSDEGISVRCFLVPVVSDPNVEFYQIVISNNKKRIHWSKISDFIIRLKYYCDENNIIANRFIMDNNIVFNKFKPENIPEELNCYFYKFKIFLKISDIL